MKNLMYFLLLLFSNSVLAQHTLPSKTTGYVNFNLGSSTITPQKKYKQQGVTLFGCNTMISNSDTSNWSGDSKGLTWNKDNQVFTNLPYGYQLDEKTNAPYYVSKYYIASPPVFLRDKMGNSTDTTQYDIGIVTPDKFVFDGNKPVQPVFMQYDILKPMKIQYIPVKFDSTFSLWKVDIVPFSVECEDFPWLDNNDIEDAQGASGIGFLDKNVKQLSQLFLPYYEGESTTNQSKKYLDCEVSILNDVLFHHEVYFKVNGEKKYALNLRDFYANNPNDSIHLYCDYKNELPEGCKEPKTGQNE